MYSARKRCAVCHEFFWIYKETQVEINMAMPRLKYCPECRAEKIKQQKRSSHVKRKPVTEFDKFGTQAEWNKGFQKFWEKRGTTPPQGVF